MAKSRGTNKDVTNSSDRETSMVIVKNENKKMDLSDEEYEEEKERGKNTNTTWRMI